jgi:hypothetical protein
MAIDRNFRAAGGTVEFSGDVVKLKRADDKP